MENEKKNCETETQCENRIKIKLEETTKISADQTELAKPTLEVKGEYPNNAFEMTQVQSPGYVDGGVYTTEVPVQEIDADLIPANVKKGVNIMGVVGEAAGELEEGFVDVSIKTMEYDETFEPSPDKDGFSKFRIRADVDIPKENKQVVIDHNGAPATIVKAEEGKILDSVEITADVKANVKPIMITNEDVGKTIIAEDKGVEGFSSISVNVDAGEYIQPVKRVKKITTTGPIEIKPDQRAEGEEPWKGMRTVLVDSVELPLQDLNINITRDQNYQTLRFPKNELPPEFYAHGDVAVHVDVKPKLLALPEERISGRTVFNIADYRGYDGFEYITVIPEVEPKLYDYGVQQLRYNDRDYEFIVPEGYNGLKGFTAHVHIDPIILDSPEKIRTIRNQDQLIEPIEKDSSGMRSIVAHVELDDTYKGKTIDSDTVLNNKPNTVGLEGPIYVQAKKPVLKEKTIVLSDIGMSKEYIAEDDASLGNPAGYSSVKVDVQVPIANTATFDNTVFHNGANTLNVLNGKYGFEDPENPIAMKNAVVNMAEIPTVIEENTVLQLPENCAGWEGKAINVAVKPPLPNVKPYPDVVIRNNNQRHTYSAADLGSDVVGITQITVEVKIEIEELHEAQITADGQVITPTKTLQKEYAAMKAVKATLVYDTETLPAELEAGKTYTAKPNTVGFKGPITVAPKTVKLTQIGGGVKFITANTTEPIKVERNPGDDGIDNFEIVVNVPAPPSKIYDGPINFALDGPGRRLFQWSMNAPPELAEKYDGFNTLIIDQNYQEVPKITKNGFIPLEADPVSHKAYSGFMHNAEGQGFGLEVDVKPELQTVPTITENGVINLGEGKDGFIGSGPNGAIEVNVPAPTPPKIVDSATFTFDAEKDYPLPAGDVSIPLNIYECDEVENRDAAGMKTALFNTKIAEFPKTPLKNGQTVELPAGAVAFEGPITVNVESAVMPADQPFEYKLRGVNPVEYVDWDKNAPPELKEKYDGFKKIKIIQRYQEIPKITKNGDIPLKVDPQYGNRYYTGFMHRMANGNYGLEVDVKPELQVVPKITANPADGKIKLDKGKDGFIGTGPNGELEIDVKSEPSEYDGSLLESLCAASGVDREIINLSSKKINEIKPGTTSRATIDASINRGASNCIFQIDMPNLHKMGKYSFGGQGIGTYEFITPVYLDDYDARWLLEQSNTERIRNSEIHINSFSTELDTTQRTGLVAGSGGNTLMSSTRESKGVFSHVDFYLPERSKFPSIIPPYLFGQATSPYRDSTTSVIFVNDDQTYNFKGINFSGSGSYQDGHGYFETNGWINFNNDDSYIAKYAGRACPVILTSKRKCLFSGQDLNMSSTMYVPDELYDEYAVDPKLQKVVNNKTLFKISQLPVPYHTVTVDNWEPPQPPTV